MTPKIKALFHQPSSTLCYIVTCPESRKCAVIDPVLDFDIYSGAIDTQFAAGVIDYIRENDLQLEWLLETHAHADHVTAASYLKKKLGGNIACGSEITSIQQTFKEVFNLTTLNTNGEQFDRLLHDGDQLALGNCNIKVLATPGHTPDSLTYLIGNNAFIGDTLFMPDSGSARCDFPSGSAAQLYQSIQKIYQLGNDITLYMCHDYQPNQRALRYACPVSEQKEMNIHIACGVSEQEYVTTRQQRDTGLAIPRLLYPSLQFNIIAGQLPAADESNKHYLKLPLSGIDKLD
ncbi:MBL fold metallo-hydrolase [Thalassomonas haliotis]|uniref:MBL fold metallo-hydrolase n=1 Tax=Thalassomonas haliotis TaxID=485448 RepID=A0ABY7V8Z5_9GAMM|nr:MBL fold metallo-hydrolase [Thalassomonas haliotis]WDE10068.1 MBL fold metallo-hydrolase [Thalassomonas haliotis]